MVLSSMAVIGSEHADLIQNKPNSLTKTWNLFYQSYITKPKEIFNHNAPRMVYHGRNRSLTIGELRFKKISSQLAALQEESGQRQRRCWKEQCLLHLFHVRLVDNRQPQMAGA